MGTCKYPPEFRAAAFWIDGRRFDKTVHVMVTTGATEIRFSGRSEMASTIGNAFIANSPNFSHSV